MNTGRQYFLKPDIDIILEKGDIKAISQVFDELHPADIAEVIELTDDKHLGLIVDVLSPEALKDVFEFLDEESEIKILSLLKRPQVREILDEMPSDERADLFEVMAEKDKKQYLPLMPKEDREDVLTLLSHPEESAGTIMSTEYISVNPDNTVEEAMEIVRERASESAIVYYIYVVNKRGHLKGVLTLKDLFLAKKKQKIKAIMEDNVISARVDEDRERVANLIKKYGFLALPIVDDRKCLVGVVTVDDAMDVLTSEATEDIHKLGAIAPIERGYLKTNIFKSAWRRLVWLAFFLIVGTFTGSIIKSYDYVLASLMGLAYFIPMLSGTAGNAGSQTSTMVIRAIATGELRLSDTLIVVLREMSIGVIIGIILSVLAYARAIYWLSNPMIGVAVGLSIVAIVVTSTTFGALIPLIIKAIHLDPAVISMPLIATFMDVVSIFAYFEISRLVLGL